MSRRIALLAWIASAGATAALGEDWQKIFTISDRPELRLDARDGSVTVRAWDEKSISARVMAAGWTLGPGGLEILERQSGDRVEIDLRIPSQGKDFRRRAIRVEMRVPRTTTLDIQAGGAIQVSDTLGEARLTTGEGGIDCMAVDGVVEARSSGGTITVKGRLDGVRLRTFNGGIDVWLMPGSKLGQGGRIETGDGSVAVRLPGDFAADLDLRTAGGGVTVEVPVAPAEKKTGLLRGKVNGGGPILWIRSKRGPIQVRKL